MQRSACPGTPGKTKGCVICETKAAFDFKVYDFGAVGEIMQRGVLEPASSF